MRKLIFSLVLLQISIQLSYAGTLPQEAKFPCSKEIENTLSKWSTRPYEWIKQSDAVSADSWVSPTETTGTFVTVGKSEGKIVATKSSDLTSVTAVAGPSDCKLKLTISYLKEPTQKVSSSSFTNAELTSLLKTGETGIVFAFSEGMYHSVQSINIIKKVAETQKLKLTILRDPEFRSKNYSSLSKLESTELILRGMTIHYPSIMVYSKGELKGQALVGRKTENQYTEWVKQVMQ